MTTPKVSLLLALLALAACDRGKPEAGGPAFEKVLPGTVSDAMLQTDTMRVQAPIAEPTATGVPGEEDGVSPASTRQRGARPKRRASDDGEPTARPSPEPTTGAATPEPKPAASPRPTNTPG